MTIGTRLRKFREQKRLSQKEVADLLNVSQSAYCQWESDTTSYKLELLPKLADIFDVDVTDLIPNNTTVKIVNNSNNTENSVKGFHIQMDAKKLHDDLFKSYEEIIKSKEAIIASKDELIKMLKAELDKKTNF